MTSCVNVGRRDYSSSFVNNRRPAGNRQCADLPEPPPYYQQTLHHYQQQQQMSMAAPDLQQLYDKCNIGAPLYTTCDCLIKDYSRPDIFNDAAQPSSDLWIRESQNCHAVDMDPFRAQSCIGTAAPISVSVCKYDAGSDGGGSVGVGYVEDDKLLQNTLKRNDRSGPLARSRSPPEAHSMTSSTLGDNRSASVMTFKPRLQNDHQRPIATIKSVGMNNSQARGPCYGGMVTSGDEELSLSTNCATSSSPTSSHKQ